jgi:hypothetical protein
MNENPPEDELPLRKERGIKKIQNIGCRKPSIFSQYNSLVPPGETAAEGQHCPLLTGTRRACTKTLLKPPLFLTFNQTGSLAPLD